MLAVKGVPMPTTCENCMFGRSLMDTLGDAYCAIFPTLPTQVGVRPDWCPLEDVPPRIRGRWIGCGNSDHWKCSVCGTRAAFWFSEESSSEVDLDMSEWLSDFCPNCGSYNGGADK